MDVEVLGAVAGAVETDDEGTVLGPDWWRRGGDVVQAGHGGVVGEGELERLHGDVEVSCMRCQ